MWIILNQQVQPDATYWHGRRWLAALDAVAWPAMLAAPFAAPFIAHFVVSSFSSLVAPFIAPLAGAPLAYHHTGLVGQVVVALAVGAALTRLRRALWANHRYRFTTWRCGRALALLLALGVLLKLGAA
jgi:hypothetical protein